MCSCSYLHSYYLPLRHGRRASSKWPLTGHFRCSRPADAAGTRTLWPGRQCRTGPCRGIVRPRLSLECATDLNETYGQMFILDICFILTFSFNRLHSSTSVAPAPGTIRLSLVSNLKLFTASSTHRSKSSSTLFVPLRSTTVQRRLLARWNETMRVSPISST